MAAQWLSVPPLSVVSSWFEKGVLPFYVVHLRIDLKASINAYWEEMRIETKITLFFPLPFSYIPNEVVKWKALSPCIHDTLLTPAGGCWVESPSPLISALSGTPLHKHLGCFSVDTTFFLMISNAFWISKKLSFKLKYSDLKHLAALYEGV